LNEPGKRRRGAVLLVCQIPSGSRQTNPKKQVTKRQTLGILGRAVDTMITVSGINDVVRIYYTTRTDGINFNLAYIGTDFNEVSPAPFDQGYMRKLFEYGYVRARQGYPWSNKPPFPG
jgi:hypothetical protein